MRSVVLVLAVLGASPARTVTDLVLNSEKPVAPVAYRRMHLPGAESKFLFEGETYTVQVSVFGARRQLVLFAGEQENYRTFTDLDADGKVDHAALYACEPRAGGQRCVQRSYTRAHTDFPMSDHPENEALVQSRYESELTHVLAAYGR